VLFGAPAVAFTFPRLLKKKKNTPQNRTPHNFGVIRDLFFPVVPSPGHKYQDTFSVYDVSACGRGPDHGPSASTVPESPDHAALDAMD